MSAKLSSDRPSSDDQLLDTERHTWENPEPMETIEADDSPIGFAPLPGRLLREMYDAKLQRVLEMVPRSYDAQEQEEIDRIVDHLRLRYFFGGQAVAYVSCDHGPVVVSHADAAADLQYCISDLISQGYPRLHLSFPSPLDLSSPEDLPFFLTTPSQVPSKKRRA